MNYIPEVAKMLGVEIGEEFKVKNTHDILDGRSKYNFVITENGLIEIVGKSIFEKEQLLTKLLNGSYKVIKLSKPILDEKEKEYLSAVIRPFRDKVQYITKIRYCTSEEIFIGYKGSPDDVSISNIVLPYFDSETMYKGMKAGKDYTLDELGI